VRFRFLKLPLASGVLDHPRPFLNVNVVGPRRQRPAAMLVDSGASDSMLPKAFLAGLGVEFSGEKAVVGSFTGEVYEADIASVRLSFGGGKFDLMTRVLGFPGPCIPVLGVSDFFNRYFVAFDTSAQVFMVSEPRRMNEQSPKTSR
jgi:hypothetical protein